MSVRVRPPAPGRDRAARRHIRSAGAAAWLALGAALAVPAGTAAAPLPTPDPGAPIAAGEAYFARGDYEAAVSAWTEAAEAMARRGDAPGRAGALGRRAEAYQALGFHRKAVADLEAAIALAERAADERLAARLRGSLANSLIYTGELARAERELAACLAYADARGDRPLAALALNSIGNLLASPHVLRVPSLGRATTDTRSAAAAAPGDAARPETAQSAYDSSRSIAAEQGLAGLAALAALNQAQLALEDAPEDAPALLAEAGPALERLGESEAKAYGLVGLGRLYAQLGDGGGAIDSTERAYRAFDAARAVAEAIGSAGAASHAAGSLGRLYEARERYDEGLQLTRRALHHAVRLEAPELAYLWHWQIGRLHRALGAPDRALASYRQAVLTLGSIRRDLVQGVGGPSFQEAVGAVYLELADLMLRRAAAGTSAPEQQRLLREVRQTMEQLKTAELENYFQDDCVSALQARFKPVDDVGERTAALYPIIFPDRLELLVSLPDRIERTSVAVRGEQVTATVHEFRRLLAQFATREHLAPSRTLYDWLVRPVEAALREAQVDTLVLVPGGVLRTIPISALHDGRQYLVEKYAIAVVPGLTLLDPRPLEETRVDLLLGGLTESVQGFPALPYVAGELEAIQRLFGGERLQDAEFRSERVQSALEGRPYTIVHLATHAQFEGRSRESFLLTYDGRLTMDGLERLVKLSQFREQPVELLTLSACETAAGDDQAALGLAGIAVKAGARSTLASLWFINDQATAELISAFYQALSGPRLSKAKALQQAQIGLLASASYDHPFFWAPFLLIGNWL